jgi:membrane-associated phospholipid phosphatase
MIRGRFLSSLLPMGIFCLAALATAHPAHAQQTPATSSEDSPPASGPAQNAPIPPADRDVSWHKLPGNFLHDQKDMWLFPVQLAHGKHWLPTAGVVGVTAGLIAADAHDTSNFRRTSSFSGFNRGFSGPITAAEIAAVPAALYAVGLARKDSYAQKTALLAGEAVGDGMILTIVVKALSRRLRPSDIAPRGNFSDTFFRSRPSIVGAGSAFPSGHAMAAFSVATVVARRYRKHRWVPWVAYGLAGTIGFSRVTLQSHFPSDVFLGGALGYTIARFAVLHGQ